MFRMSDCRLLEVETSPPSISKLVSTEDWSSVKGKFFASQVLVEAVSQGKGFMLNQFCRRTGYHIPAAQKMLDKEVTIDGIKLPRDESRQNGMIRLGRLNRGEFPQTVPKPNRKQIIEELGICLYRGNVDLADEYVRWLHVLIRNLNTLLYEAARGGHQQSVDWVMELFEDWPLDTSWALRGAICGGHLENLRLPPCDNIDTRTFLIEAIKGGQVELISKKDVITNWTSLFIQHATVGGHIEILQRLIDWNGRTFKDSGGYFDMGICALKCQSFPILKLALPHLSRKQMSRLKNVAVMLKHYDVVRWIETSA